MSVIRTRTLLSLLALWIGCGIPARDADAQEPGKLEVRSEAGLHDAGAEPRDPLRLRLSEGEAFRLVYQVDQNIVQRFPGQTFNIKQTVEMGIIFDCEQVTDAGRMVTRVTFGRLRMNQQGPMGRVVYDSERADGPVPPLASGYAALVGNGFVAVFDPAGRVAEVRGAKELRDRVIDSIKLDNPQMRRMFRQQMAQSFGPEGLKDMIEQMTAVHPGEPVGTGAIWTRSQNLAFDVPMDVTTTYRLASRDGDGVRLDLASRMEEIEGDAGGVFGMPDATMEMSGTQRGTLVLDLETGLPADAQLTQELQMDVAIPGPGGGEVNVPMKMDAVIRLKGESVNAPAR